MKKTNKNKHKAKKFNLLLWIKNNKFLILAFAVFLVMLFTRFYQPEIKNPFGYDQVDNAWAAKNIVADGRYPLVGMVAKGNSGIYIGPLYYYFAAFFYFLSGLDPIASVMIAGVSAIISFWIIYFFTKKLFNEYVALIAVVINTFALPAIIFDRIQWPVDFIPAFSLVIFYLLYKVITGEVKKLLWLAVVVGLMFNIHFTAIFFPLIVLFCLPLFPRTRETIKYILFAIPLFIIFIIPNAIYMLTSKSSGSNISYLDSNFHGFHLRRMMQLVGDAFIQFDPYVVFDWLKKIKIFIPLIFVVIYLWQTADKNKYKFIYLVALFFMIPWIVFTTYSGEISDYYFAVNRYIVLFIISYLFYSVGKISFKNKILNVVPKIFVVLVLAYYCIYNLTNFLPYKDVGLKKRFENAQPSVDHNVRIEFQMGVPESYIYYYLMLKKTGKDVY